MGGLIRAEFRKLLSTQLWFWMLLAVMAITALGVVAQILNHSQGFLPGDVRGVYSSSQTAYIAALVVGVLAVTTEFRYQTITPTLLATPSRMRVIAAKLISYTLIGACYAVVTIVLALAIALPWLAAKHVSYSGADVPATLFGVFISVMLWALFGLGFGALVRNQVVGVVVSIVFVIVLQPLISVIPKVRAAYPYTPAGASDAMLSANPRTNFYTLLHPVAGGIVLLVWGLGLAILGASVTMNRDIS